MTRNRRFIAGAVCPQCGEQDTLYLLKPIEQGSEEVCCVSCDYREQRPEPKAPVAEAGLIGRFKL